jgi:hypothetical protein
MREEKQRTIGDYHSVQFRFVSDGLGQVRTIEGFLFLDHFIRVADHVNVN